MMINDDVLVQKHKPTDSLAHAGFAAVRASAGLNDLESAHAIATTSDDSAKAVQYCKRIEKYARR